MYRDVIIHFTEYFCLKLYNIYKDIVQSSCRDSAVGTIVKTIILLPLFFFHLKAFSLLPILYLGSSLLLLPELWFHLQYPTFHLVSFFPIITSQFSLVFPIITCRSYQMSPSSYDLHYHHLSSLVLHITAWWDPAFKDPQPPLYGPAHRPVYYKFIYKDVFNQS